MSRPEGGLVLGLLSGVLASFVVPGWLAVVLAIGIVAASLMLTRRPSVEDDVHALVRTAEAFAAGDRLARSTLPEDSDVAELGVAFDAMVLQVGAMMEAREELLAAVAHELRTPLNRLRFGIELVSSIDDPEVRDAKAQAMQRDIEELDDLVRELLTWGRLDSVRGTLKHESVNLATLAQRLADDAKTLGASDVEVEVAEGTRFQAEPRLIRRAWRNGVTNAVRYGTKRVVIGARVEEDGLHLWVDDDGPGVPADRREDVFEPFVRLDGSRSSSTGGTGLGLALVARIARAHGGTATIEDSPLGGARLHLHLPS